MLLRLGYGSLLPKLTLVQEMLSTKRQEVRLCKNQNVTLPHLLIELLNTSTEIKFYS